jgi:hypothetical protein
MIVVSVEGSAVDVGKALNGYSRTPNNVTGAWRCSNHASSGAFPGEFGVPRSVIAEHGIKNGKAFSSDGNAYNFVLFTRGRRRVYQGSTTVRRNNATGMCRVDTVMCVKARGGLD